ncbi:hypothetical protein [Rhodococcus sp. SJ-3]|uniref:hypothetical protein n=1 Tax=Rhodococcus sp. SJ-3 TaxID=3454628 RepID=UPI003F7B02AA
MGEVRPSSRTADGSLAAVSTAADQTRSALAATDAAVEGQNAAIRTAHDGGATVAQLVAASGLSRGAVHKILAAGDGADRQVRVRRLLADVESAAERCRQARECAAGASAERRSSIARAIDEGARVVDVQRATGLSRARVDAILQEREA